jgi:CRISPR-associated protein Csb2
VPRLESGNVRYGTPAVPTAFVPHNYPRNQSGNQVLPWIRLTQGKISRHFPSVALERDRVHFIWPTSAPLPIRQAWETLVEHIGYLGASSSKVRVAVCDSPPNPEFRPCSQEEAGGELVLGIPYRGRLDALERAYAANRRATPGRPFYYRRVVQAAPPPAQSAFDHLFILRVAGRIMLPARYAVVYTAVLRKAVMERAAEAGIEVAAIHGHNGAPHCAFLALPHTGHPHAESAIKAFSIAFPQGMDEAYRLRLQKTAAAITTLTFGHHGECAVAPPDDRPALRTAEPETWIGPSRIWTSVTPLLLDRFPKTRPGDSIPEIVASSCDRAGLPVPVSIEFGEYSTEPGVQPVREFSLRRKPGEPPRMAKHVTLEFDREVRGPVVLGAGRFFGLGLCKPLYSAEGRQ